ncbi:hypothetical protein [Parablautia muri]|jgi:hypothetical protein|uniref:Uncharacterized protein n=1 Tax=Parablautia muri TaxID=2320879 RepID=A0A9X5BJA4_9FIRM|nr:hypothetical protein [Parablautia muri]NBI93096.1 hypothetical protein [Lachnospiraceae bacterium]NBJ94970.1 hypothetical protein [Parablautia muri]
MRAEDTLQFMADFYPSIFPTRKHCLNHLFCTIGNGYRWVKGELVEDDDKKYNRYRLVKPVRKAEFEDERDWWVRYRFELEMHEETGKRINPDYFFEWSQPSREYSYIYHFPKNIRPDWKALLEECRQMLKEDGVEI